MTFSEKISAAEQTQLLEKCLAEGIDLAAELRACGLSFDDLRYSANPDLLVPHSTDYQLLDEVRRVPNGIPAISFFAGAGGFDVGFHCAGYDNLASLEINRVFCDTLRFNFPQKLVVGPPDFSGDVRQKKVIAEVLRHRLGLDAPFEGVFHGGPPCQPFSIAANQRFSKNGENFKRVGFGHQEYGNLLFDYLWFIQEFRPRVFILENVAGFMEMDKGAQVRRAMEVLGEIGYSTTAPQVFDLADFGIPQHRNRFVMVGSRTESVFHFPQKKKNRVPCWEALRRDMSGLPNHDTREHKAESLLRYQQLNFGKRDKLGRVDRLNPATPSKTVIAGGLKGGGRSHLHPYIPRTLSARECARLQTFPDWYVFTGAIARQFTQVGNAVPPLFAYQLAVAIQQQFFDLQAPRSHSPQQRIAEPTLFAEFA